MSLDIIPTKHQDAYEFIELLEKGTFKAKHLECGEEGKYRNIYFKQEIPCRHCRKKDTQHILNKMKKHFTKRLVDFDLVDAETVVHRNCGETIKLPSTWKTKKNHNLCQKCFRINKDNKNHERNRQRVWDTTNGEYEMIGRFEGFGIPVMVRHNGDCGFEYPVSMNDFLNKDSRCPKCANLVVTKVMFVERLQQVNPDYVLVSEYHNLSKDVTVYHKVCEKNETKVARAFLTADTPCSFCNNNIKDIDVMREKIFAEVGDEYELLTFENQTTPALFLHTTCGTRYTQYPRIFRKGLRCPECSKGGRPRINPDTIIRGENVKSKEAIMQEQFAEKFPLYTLIDKHTAKHNSCGREIPLNWNVDKLKKEANLCKECGNKEKQAYWHEKQSQLVRDISNGDYELVSTYEAYRKPAVFKHLANGCNEEFEVLFYSFVKHKASCPKCRKK